MRNPAFLRRIALLLLVTLSPLALDGCLSVGVSRTPLQGGAGEAPPPDGAVAVTIYRKSADRDARRPVTYPVLSELVSEGDGKVVARSMAGVWELNSVPAGAYRLVLSKMINPEGDIQPLKDPGEKSLQIRAGERTDVAVVLEKVPVLWIVLAAITVIALIIVSINLAERGKIPLPPLPPPPPNVFVGVAVSFPVGEGHGREPAPGVADVFPAKDSVVAARRVTVSFLMTRPLAAERIEEGAVLALGTKSGEIPGVVTWRPEEQLLRFSPSRDFTPGETVTVTVDLGKLKGEGGRSGEGRVSTTFRVAD